MHINLSDSKLYKPLRTISHCRLNNSENRGTASDFSPKIIENKGNRGVNHFRKSVRDRKIFGIFWDFLGFFGIFWDFFGIYRNF